MKKLLYLILLTPSLLLAQLECEPYGKKVFDLIIHSNNELRNEFIELVEYQSYVDRLTVASNKKEELKEHALNNYMTLKKNFLLEVNRVFEFYGEFQKDGVSFTYQYCTHAANPKYPGIGFIELHYLVEEGKNIMDDSISFECIMTSNGWRIIDGFYQENPK